MRPSACTRAKEPFGSYGLAWFSFLQTQTVEVRSRGHSGGIQETVDRRRRRPGAGEKLISGERIRSPLYQVRPIGHARPLQQDASTLGRYPDKSELRLGIIRISAGFVLGLVIEPISVRIPEGIHPGPPKKQSLPPIRQPVAIQ